MEMHQTEKRKFIFIFILHKTTLVNFLDLTSTDKLNNYLSVNYNIS